MRRPCSGRLYAIPDQMTREPSTHRTNATKNSAALRCRSRHLGQLLHETSHRRCPVSALTGKISIPKNHISPNRRKFAGQHPGTGLHPVARWPRLLTGAAGKPTCHGNASPMEAVFLLPILRKALPHRHLVPSPPICVLHPSPQSSIPLIRRVHLIVRATHAPGGSRTYAKIFDAHQANRLRHRKSEPLVACTSATPGRPTDSRPARSRQRKQSSASAYHRKEFVSNAASRSSVLVTSFCGHKTPQDKQPQIFHAAKGRSSPQRPAAHIAQHLRSQSSLAPLTNWLITPTLMPFTL